MANYNFLLSIFFESKHKWKVEDQCNISKKWIFSSTKKINLCPKMSFNRYLVMHSGLKLDVEHTNTSYQV